MPGAHRLSAASGAIGDIRMEKKKALRFGAAGAVGLVALAAAALALAPERRGLASMDLDNDGQIVSAEIQQSARQRFAEMDSNGDGRLSGEEVPRGRNGRGRGRHGPDHAHDHGGETDPQAAAPASAQPGSVPVQPQPVRRGLAGADVNGDGALDLREFYARHLARAVRADSNRDGTISAEELEAFRPRRRGHRD
jgi:hypothetical protein